MNLAEYDISRPYQASVLSTERLTPPDYDVEVRHIVLRIPAGDFDFVEGQSIGVLVPGPHEFGNPHHLRLYSIASSRREDAGSGSIAICVRRCFYLDEISGERYPGVASNFLCDARPGDPVLLTGPYGAHFSLPADANANLLMIGAGTGIAPFRAFVRHIYEERGGWKGDVRLYYGARRGTELLYRNDKVQDLGLFYDDRTFRAFEAVSARPALDPQPALDKLLLDHQEEVWKLINAPNTYLYLAGLAESAARFEKAMAHLAGSAGQWESLRKKLAGEHRYAELLY
ncbi:MAG: hypothetical protein K2X35_24925 [Bryobacteraceae bacterium]|nr:hypothetical protein [Bryobacteraceae bacterium]